MATQKNDSDKAKAKPKAKPKQKPKAKRLIATEKGKTDAMGMNTKVKKQQMLLHLREKLGHVQNSCEAVGIFRSTHYRWLDSDPDYAQAILDVQEAIIDDVESWLLDNAKDKDTVAQIFYLKTKGKKRGYDQSERHEVTVTANADLKTVPTDLLLELAKHLGTNRYEDEE